MNTEKEELYGDEPVRHVSRGGVEYTLLGTAHVSRTSAEAVRRLIEHGSFDAVAIELCPARHKAMTEQDSWRDMNLFQVIRQGKGGMMIASLALAAYQRRIAKQFGIEPGAEMKDRKSTRLNSSHVAMSYAVFCLRNKTRRRESTS